MTLDELLSHLHGVKKQGDGYTCKCPTHADKRNSLSISQADGKILLKCHAGCSAAEIVEALGLKLGDLFDKPKRAARPQRVIYKTYDYTDADGALVFQVVRFKPKDFRQRRPDPVNPRKYLWNLQGVDRPLYNLPAVLAAQKANKAIFVVEGEKDADSLASLGLTATTNAGGAAKWSPRYSDVLNAGTAVILPDNDDAGAHHAATIAAQLTRAVVLRLPGLPVKGDVTDWIAAGGTREALVDLARQALTDKDAEPPAPAAPLKPTTDWKRPFRCLGHNSGQFYFLSSRSRQIVAMSASAFQARSNFLALAPLSFWEQHYESKQGADWTMAADSLISECLHCGLFSPDRRRGRGAWWDEDRAVLHLGDHLVVDGESVDPLDLKSKYLYEAGPRLAVPHTTPLGTDQASRLFDLTSLLPWHMPVYETLLAGWCAIAPICGVLRWRPHLWVTGPAGSGKSWIVEHVIGRLVGAMALRVQSVTTEAGLRQSLGGDARPVIFDEAEMEDNKGAMNIQRVLELARQASSEAGAQIVKGTASGHALTFTIRSAFCLASIGVGVHRRADESRVTVLSLQRRPADDKNRARFETLQSLASEICTPEFSAGLVARSCKLSRVIRTNAQTMAIAVAQILGSRRSGDQLGALLAGAYSLHSDNEITLPEALEYAEARVSVDGLVPDEESEDESRCLAHLIEQRIRVNLPSGTLLERSIGELVAACNGQGEISDTVANDHLRRHGLSVTPEGLHVSTSHSGVRDLLFGTPWSVGWALFLRRLSGATAPRQSVRFSGTQTKTTLIPWGTVNGGNH